MTLKELLTGALLQLDRGTAGWAVVRALQWVLMGAVLAGLLWTLFMMFAPAMGLMGMPTVYWWGWPAQFVLLAVGVVAGLVLAGVSRLAVSIAARAKANRADRTLHEAIAEVTDSELLTPVQDELDRHRRAVEAVQRAA